MGEPLEKKTIRPGKLSNYSYYYSDRHPESAADQPKPAGSKKSKLKLAGLVAVLAVLVIGLPLWRSAADSDGSDRQSNAVTSQPTTNKGGSSSKVAPVHPAEPEPVANACVGNTEPKAIIIVVEARHLWACERDKAVMDTPVITGLRGHAETETPLGTHKVYAKTTNTTLTGQDSRGSWRYPVYYWMPFLDNQYGTYGFHDATWRAENLFGNVSPDSNDASHGCVELPLNAQKQLYEWTPEGTPVIVKA